MESSNTRRPGWIGFAGIMFVVAGFANLVWGIGAVADKGYLSDEGLLFSSLSFWGWIAIIWGALLLLGSYLILTDSPSGRGTGIVLAVVSAIFWLIALPVLPIFALVAILIDSLIIYGLSEPA